MDDDDDDDNDNINNNEEHDSSLTFTVMMVASLRNWFLYLVCLSIVSLFFLQWNFQHGMLLRNQLTISSVKNHSNRNNDKDFEGSVLQTAKRLLTLYLNKSNQKLHLTPSPSKKLANESKANFTNAAVIDTLQRILEEAPYSLYGERFENASVQNRGDTRRFDLALLQAISSRRRLRVAAVGGSITAGAIVPWNVAYSNVFVQWLATALANVGISVTFTNAAIGSTPSEYFSLCASEFINFKETDILIVEFAVNDWRAMAVNIYGYDFDPSRPMEELVRAVWRLNPMIHIIIVNNANLESLFSANPRCQGMEEIYSDVIQHYNLPSVHWKHIFCDNQNETPLTPELGKRLAGLFSVKDNVHPSGVANLLMADFLANYVKSSIRILIDRLNVTLSNSTVSEIMSEDPTLIRNETSDLLFKIPPIYRTTRIEGSECFVAYKRPFKKSDRLIDAITATSINYTNSESRLEIQTYVFSGRVFIDRLQTFRLDDRDSFIDFHLNVSSSNATSSVLCQHSGVLPHLAIAFKACRIANCSAGVIRVDAALIYSDGTIYNATTAVRVDVYDIANNVVLYLPNSVLATNGLPKVVNAKHRSNAAASIFTKFKSEICTKGVDDNLSSIDVRITKVTSSYKLQLHSVIVANQCCDTTD